MRRHSHQGTVTRGSGSTGLNRALTVLPTLAPVPEHSSRGSYRGIDLGDREVKDMRSRGLWTFMGARTRRSLTFTWTALFVLSLLLQYAAFAAAPAVLAVHDDQFQLDGNAIDDAGSAQPDDWATLTGGGGSAD